MRKRKSHKLANKKFNDIAKLLLQSCSWSELNIRLAIFGYELDSDIILTIIHFAFISPYSYSTLLNNSTKISSIETIHANCQDILVDACEDDTTAFTKDMIDKIMSKIVFEKHTEFAFNKNKIKRIVVALAKKDQKSVKDAYEKCITFSRYSV